MGMTITPEGVDVAWEREFLGVRCAVAVSPLGTCCGYVELPEGWDDGGCADVGDLGAPGGVTYRRGRVIGFDCAHPDMWDWDVDRTRLAVAALVVAVRVPGARRRR